MSRGYTLIVLKGDGLAMEIGKAGGVMNSSGYATDGFVTLQGLDVSTVDKLIPRNNLNDVSPATRYPVAILAP